MLTDSAHLDRLIDRQAHLWELRRRVAEEGGKEARAHLAHHPEGPWITISSQLGSAGRALADSVASRLSWQVFDREILEAIARQTHALEAIVSRLDDRAVSILEDYLRHLIVPGDPGRASYVQELTKLIWTLGRHGKAVIVGRGANWILDPRYGLRVRVVAPLHTRIVAVMQSARIDEAAARRRIEEDDRLRSEFIRQVYRREIADGEGYDLVLNSGALDVESATEIALLAIARKLA